MIIGKILNKRVLNPIIKNIGATNSANAVKKRDKVEPIPIGSENLKLPENILINLSYPWVINPIENPNLNTKSPI